MRVLVSFRSCILGISARAAIVTQAVLLAMVVSGLSARAQTISILHTFVAGGDGAMPFGSVLIDDGNLYGTTEIGGPASAGTVFKLDRHGNEALYAFTGGMNGQLPLSSLIRDAAGNFYGTIFAGGTHSKGALYTISRNGKERTLYSFKGQPDGENPYPALLRDAQGNFYGTTYIGGTRGEGVAFKLDATGAETVLHSFTGGQDGRFPYASLIMDDAGNLYGTTLDGGPQDLGVVFKLDTEGNETVLYRFAGGADGAYPFAGLFRDHRGNLYGTTFMGGGNGCGGQGCGTVFKVDSSSKETVLYRFEELHGANPYGGLIHDSDGNLYGTTLAGGVFNSGVVYKLNRQGQQTVLYSFTGGADGAYPYATLVRDAAGNLYGTTWEGGDVTCTNPNGPYGCGVVFKLAPK